MTRAITTVLLILALALSIYCWELIRAIAYGFDITIKMLGG